MVTRKAPRSTLVLLVRHGETPTTGKVLPGRAPGLHLSERGRAQADRVAERLAGVRVDAGVESGTVIGTGRNTREAGDEFPTQLGDLLAYFGGTHPQIIAATANGYRPAIWLLGSSDYSAHAAGVLGLPFSFAHHFASGGTAQALDVYRESFRPSQWLEQPYSMIGVPVICAADSEEATFLSRFASKVTIIHRRDSFRASEIMQQRAFDDPKIEVLWNAEVVGINGEDKVRSVTVRDTESHQTSELPVTGLLVAIGSDHRTALVKDQLELTVDGTIAVDGRSSTTSLAGVFAAGDVVDATYRQAITAAGSGCVAAVDTEHYLAALHDRSVLHS